MSSRCGRYASATRLWRGADFTRYILGKIDRTAANGKIWSYVTDPVSIYQIWFEDYARGDPIAERRDGLVDGLVSMLDGLRKMLDGSKQLQRDIQAAFAGTDNEALTVTERDIRQARFRRSNFQGGAKLAIRSL